MRRPAIGLGALIAFALISSAAIGVEGPSQIEKTFLIPASEGYGVGECLTDGASACGQVVANAWCEAQGFAAAGSFGIAAQDEYTGAIAPAPAAKRTEAPIRITCQD
ncbi:MAG TPA: hypothetical protein VF641_01140 [Methylobacterium sp.]|jgi:hypothetical protein